MPPNSRATTGMDSERPSLQSSSTVFTSVANASNEKASALRRLSHLFQKSQESLPWCPAPLLHFGEDNNQRVQGKRLDQRQA